MPGRPSRKDEAELATYYQQHRDDPEEWSEPLTPEPDAERPRGLATTITVRFPIAEAALIRRMAKEIALSYSDIVRHAVRAYMQPRFDVAQASSANLLFVAGQVSACTQGGSASEASFPEPASNTGTPQ